MIVSYQWLKSYFGNRLPPPEEVAEILTARAFEVEDVEENGTDVRFDVKILPDRAGYALSHRGIVYEISAAIKWPFVISERKAPAEQNLPSLEIIIENSQDCHRYMGRRVLNVSVEENRNKDIRDRLEAIGQRSINNIVDAANYVTLDMGQPLHAFDADKVKGRITVRRAKKGEAITTLDGKKIELSPDILIIADDEGPLAIAGIKGGVRAAVNDQTKNLILESANFGSTLIRKTSARVDIRTDASKRFENEPSPELAKIAMDEFSALIAESCPDARFGEIVDEYPTPQKPQTITISSEEISQKLGIKLGSKEIAEVLERLGIKVEFQKEKLILGIPPERLDLTIPEDIAEEVGRLVGYDKVSDKLPPKTKTKLEISKQFYWEWKIREFLVNEGFSEVMTSSFSEKGSIAIEKPLASDKSFLRENLSKNIEAALKINLVKLPLLGIPQVKVFEIGKIFPSFAEASEGEPKASEHTSLAIGIAQPKGFKGEKVNEQIRAVRDELVASLGAPVQTVCTIDDTGGIILMNGKPIGEINRLDGILELNLDVLVAVLPESKQWNVEIPRSTMASYTSFSPFPFIVRDIAFFVSSETDPKDTHRVIEKEAGKLAQRVEMFDRFEKNGKTSFAFRIVFQAGDRTLTDEEANKIMEKVSAALVKKFKAEIR